MVDLGQRSLFMIRPEDTELDRWLVTEIGESRKIGGLLVYLAPTFKAALRDAALRISNRLVYDLQRRFQSVPRQHVLKTWEAAPASM